MTGCVFVSSASSPTGWTESTSATAVLAISSNWATARREFSSPSDGQPLRGVPPTRWHQVQENHWRQLSKDAGCFEIDVVPRVSTICINACTINARKSIRTVVAFVDGLPMQGNLRRRTRRSRRLGAARCPRVRPSPRRVPSQLDRVDPAGDVMIPGGGSEMD